MLGNKATARQVAAGAATPLVQGQNKACTLDEVRSFFDVLGEFSPGLSNLEYAPLAEIMGRVPDEPRHLGSFEPYVAAVERLLLVGAFDGALAALAGG